MKTCRSTLLLAILFAAPLLLSSCTGNWLVGKWELDKERTISAMEQAETPDPNTGTGGNLLKDIVGGLQKGFSRVLLTQFESVQLEFTPTEARRTRNGVGEAQGYEIIEKPSPDTYLVKTDDGTIVTWGKTSGGVRLKLGDEADNWVYFKPVE